MSSHATTFSPSADSKTKGLEANDPDELASSIRTVANRAALEGKNAAAIITRCFKGNQLLDTERYEQCKKTCSESTNKNIQNNWRGTMDVEVILRDQLRTNDEISTTMFISDYGETSTQTDTNENMVDICSFLKEHIYEHSSTNRGRYSRETPQYIKLKYEHLDLTTYSVDLVCALRDIVDLYKSQIHALIEPLLNKKNPIHLDVMRQAGGDGNKLLRLLTLSMVSTTMSAIGTHEMEMRTNAASFKLGENGSMYMIRLHKDVNKMITLLNNKEMDDGRVTTAKEFVEAMAVLHARKALYGDVRYKEAVTEQMQATATENIFTPHLLADMHANVSKRDALDTLIAASGAKTTASPGSTTAFVAGTAHMGGGNRSNTEYDGLMAHGRKELLKEMTDSTCRAKINDGTGPGNPYYGRRGPVSQRISILFDLKNYYEELGLSQEAANDKARLWCETNGVMTKDFNKHSNNNNSNNSNNTNSSNRSSRNNNSSRSNQNNKRDYDSMKNQLAQQKKEFSALKVLVAKSAKKKKVRPRTLQSATNARASRQVDEDENWPEDSDDDLDHNTSTAGGRS